MENTFKDLFMRSYKLQESAKIREMNKPFSQFVMNLGFGSLLTWKNVFIFPKDREVENVCDTINLHFSLHGTTSNLNGDHQWWYSYFLPKYQISVLWNFLFLYFHWAFTCHLIELVICPVTTPQINRVFMIF